jgi:hypothetical protein
VLLWDSPVQNSARCCGCWGVPTGCFAHSFSACYAITAGSVKRAAHLLISTGAPHVETASDKAVATMAESLAERDLLWSKHELLRERLGTTVRLTLSADAKSPMHSQTMVREPTWPNGRRIGQVTFRSSSKNGAFGKIQRTRFPTSISSAVIVRIQSVARLWPHDFWSIGILSHSVLVPSRTRF